jgi:hypothetical protein
MRLALVLSTVVLSSHLAFAQKAGKPEKLTIYVDSAQSTKEFTDPSKDRMDSVRDLIGKLKSSKFLRPVPNESDAVLLLEVTTRDRDSVVNGFALGGRSIRSILGVRLTAGDFTADFEGGRSTRMGNTFTDAAGEVAEQVNRWVEMNWDRLQSLKERGSAAGSAPASR